MTKDWDNLDRDGTFTVLDVRPVGNPPNDLSNKTVWQGYCNSPIEYTSTLAEELYAEASELFGTNKIDPLLYQAPLRIYSKVGNEFKRWICALQAYSDSPGPAIPLFDLIKGIKDKDYAQYLKAIRTKAIVYSAANQGDFLELDSDLEKLPLYYMYDIGDIFNYKYWFNWKEEPAGDIDFHQIPVGIECSSKENEDCFKRALRAILPESKKVLPVFEEEVSLSLSSSSCFNKGKKVFIEKQDNISFSKDALLGKVTYVQKGPTEVRECITLSVEQSNSVKLIEKQVSEILEDTPYSAYVKDPDERERRYQSFIKNKTYFLNRDLTKEGITKPRHLIKWMMDVLVEKYPELPAWEYRGIYENLMLVLPSGRTIGTKRGHGLGMANALTTLMQCTCFQIIKEEMESELVQNCHGLFYNDDGTIGSEDEDSIIAYADEEDQILIRFGLLPKARKSWFGKVSVLCERYSDKELNNKQSYINYVRYLPFSATNIVAAKGMAHLPLDLQWGEPREDLWEKLIRFFGYEFTPDEASLPTICGGYLNLSYKGVDCSLLNINVPPVVLARGAQVGPPQLKPRNFIKKEGTYCHPIEKVLRKKIQLPEVVEKILCINQPNSAVHAKFCRNLNGRSHEVWLQKEHQHRLDRWNKKTITIKQGYRFTYEYLVRKYPDKDILPPKDFLREVCPEYGMRDGRLKIPNPFLSTVRLFNDIDHPILKKVLPYPSFPGVGINNNVISDLEKSRSVFNMSRDPGNLGMLWTPRYEDRVLRETHWINSINVWEAYFIFTCSNAYPIPPVLSEVAQIIKGYEEHLFVCQTEAQDVNLTSVIGYELMSWLRDLSETDLQEVFASKIEQKVEIKKQRETPLLPDIDYLEWDGSGNPIFRPEWRYNIFLEIKEAISVSEILTSFSLLTEERGRNADIDVSFDDMNIAVWKKFADLEVYSKDQQTLIRLRSYSIWDNNSDDSSECGFGLFDNG